MSACTILTSLCTPCMQSLQCQQGKQREGRNGKTCIYPPSMINTEASPSGPPSVIDTEASPYNQSVVHMEASPSGPSSVINTETSPTATGQAKTGTESSVCSRACWWMVGLNWRLVTKRENIRATWRKTSKLRYDTYMVFRKAKLAGSRASSKLKYDVDPDDKKAKSKAQYQANPPTNTPQSTQITHHHHFSQYRTDW